MLFVECGRFRKLTKRVILVVLCQSLMSFRAWLQFNKVVLHMCSQLVKNSWIWVMMCPLLAQPVLFVLGVCVLFAFWNCDFEVFCCDANELTTCTGAAEELRPVQRSDSGIRLCHQFQLLALLWNGKATFDIVWKDEPLMAGKNWQKIEDSTCYFA